jgi:hypothetical protein
MHKSMRICVWWFLEFLFFEGKKRNKKPLKKSRPQALSHTARHFFGRPPGWVLC